jgi:hypothetical protein
MALDRVRRDPRPMTYRTAFADDEYASIIRKNEENIYRMRFRGLIAKVDKMKDLWLL